MRKFATIPILVGLLGACNGSEPATAPPPAEPRVRTVLEFLEDEGVLETTWAACRNDPGSLGKTPECINAGHAKERLMMLGRERAIASLKGKG